jgi:hypothetical protein
MGTLNPSVKELMMPKMGGGTAEDSMNPAMKMGTMIPEMMKPNMMGGGCAACGSDPNTLPRV